MANVEYFNPHNFTVSLPLPSGGTLILHEARSPKSTTNIVPDSMVDQFTEEWFDRFTGKDYLHKRRKGFSDKPSPKTATAENKSQTKSQEAVNKTVQKPKQQPQSQPKYSAEQVAAMNHGELHKALLELGIEADRKIEENRLRSMLAEAIGLGNIGAFI